MTLWDDPPEQAEDSEVGYRRPPKATRFTKGQSGNPAGRPRGRRREAPYEAVLGQMVTIREGGVERRVTAEEAFLLQLAKSGVEGGGAATRTALGLIEEITARRSTHRGFISVIVHMIVVSIRHRPPRAYLSSVRSLCILMRSTRFSIPKSVKAITPSSP